MAESVLQCAGSIDGDRPGVLSCRYTDDDVVGHAFEPMRTATVSLSWIEDENGVRRLEVRSDDPDATRVLMAAIDPKSQETSDPTIVAR